MTTKEPLGIAMSKLLRNKLTPAEIMVASSLLLAPALAA
jgi:hypothetical protein